MVSKIECGATCQKLWDGLRFFLGGLCGAPECFSINFAEQGSRIMGCGVKLRIY